ncbi:MAG: methylmalonyl Co-A mutase-associated GTPase MeaB, partial [Planctomycetota bacterium]
MKKKQNPSLLWQKALQRDHLALARIITLIEKEDTAILHLLEKEWANFGKSHIVGITGPPGSGKSTLVNQLIPIFRKEELSLAILAVDPTSPISGGAFLGDRLRMGRIGTDPNIFMRSFAHGGQEGGLAHGMEYVCLLLDLAGFDLILIETVGVGQIEMDIVTLAHTLVLLLSPGQGDIIQVHKAGIMEIADVYVINKADLEGAKTLAEEIRFMLNLKSSKNKWHPPVLEVSAQKGWGINELFQAIEKHKSFLEKEGLWSQKTQEIIAKNLERTLQNRWMTVLKKEEIQKEIQSISLKICRKEMEMEEA